VTIPRLSFPDGYDESFYEHEQRGYLDYVTVHLPNDRQFQVCFYDPKRLSQELEIRRKAGVVCVAEPGLIVIPRITLEYMQEAVNRLFNEGYFEHLVPLTARIK
jgi:hypothetical protein